MDFFSTIVIRANFLVLLTISRVEAHTCSVPACSTSLPFAFLPANQSINDYIYIGGVFSVHEAGTSQYQCGNVREGGIQNMEAFFWAVRTFKDRYPDRLQGVDIGAFAFDSCSSPDRAVQQVLNLETCVVGYGNPAIPPERVLGFVGPDKSSEAVTLAPILGEMDKVLVSHAATTAELDGDRFPYFLRTIPSDSEQGLVIAEVLEMQNWKYVQVVRSSDTYGTTVNDAFRAAADDRDICIVNTLIIPADATDDDMDDIVTSLLVRQETRVVVVLAQEAEVKFLLQGARRRGSRRPFTWVGTNSWGTSADIVEGVEEYAEGAITLTLEQPEDIVDDFEDYFEELMPTTSSYEPWFTEYWEKLFQCYFPGSSNINSPTVCNTNTQSLDGVAIDPHVPFVIMAVDATLAGISQALDNECSPSSGLCSAFLDPGEAKWDLIQDKILAVDISGVEFDETTGGIIGVKHRINNYRSPNQNCDEHCYEHVAFFQNNQENPEVYGSIYSYFPNGSRDENPTTECGSNPCTECGELDPRPTTTIGAGGSGPSPASESDDPPHEMRDGSWVIVLIVLASLGILFVVVFEFYLMFKMSDVRFSTRFRTMWLGQLLLFAIFLSYLTLFAFVPSPTKATCGILRFGIGSSYAMCFAVLLVKLMIIHSSKSVGYLKGIFQILMFFFAWGVQVAVDVVWLILREPYAVYDVEEERWVCNQSFENHIKSLPYVMFLILVCNLMSLKTMKISTNHREGSFIGLSAGFAIPVWLAWTLLGTYNSDSEYEDPCMAFGLFATVTIILLIMFLPKVRQMSNMGVEGIYAEDERPTPEYAPSVLAPSLRPSEGVLPPGVVMANNLAYASDHPDNAPKRKVEQEVASLVHVSPSGEVYESEIMPRVSHIAYESDPSALYMRHPGAPQTNTLRSSHSVHSLPLGYVQKAPSGTSSRVLRVTNDLAGRTPMEGLRVVSRDDQTIYATTRSARSVASQPSMYSLRKTHSLHDLGAL